METSFCSRCGFLLTGTAELLHNGGVIPQMRPDDNSTMAPRTRGLKQGLFIFLLTFLVVPIITMLTIAVDAEPFAVVISAVLFFVGGLLRMAYAMLFESAIAGGPTVEENLLTTAQGLLNRQPNPRALPSQRDIPAAAYASPPAGNWRNTNDLEPRSVTEPTTKLLEKDEFHQ